METLGFFSRDNAHSIFTMGKIFEDSDRYVYFIENHLNEWLAKDGISWTKVPLDAMSFKKEIAARTYQIQNGIRFVEITEHEFVK